MNARVALLTGMLAGAMRREVALADAGATPFTYVDVEIPVDDAGNYEPRFVVVASDGTRFDVEISQVE